MTDVSLNAFIVNLSFEFGMKQSFYPSFPCALGSCDNNNLYWLQKIINLPFLNSVFKYSFYIFNTYLMFFCDFFNSNFYIFSNKCFTKFSCFHWFISLVSTIFRLIHSYRRHKKKTLVPKLIFKTLKSNDIFIRQESYNNSLDNIIMYLLLRYVNYKWQGRG